MTILIENARHNGVKNLENALYKIGMVNKTQYIDSTSSELWDHINAVFSQGTFSEILSEIPNIVGESVDLLEEIIF